MCQTLRLAQGGQQGTQAVPGPTELTACEGWTSGSKTRCRRVGRRRGAATLCAWGGSISGGGAVFKEGGGTACGPKGPKGKGSFWTTEMMCLWRGPPMATEAFSTGTQPAHGDQAWEGPEECKHQAHFPPALPPPACTPASELSRKPEAREAAGGVHTVSSWLRGGRKHAVCSTRMNGCECWEGLQEKG